jgi:hypothetical protein
MLELVNSSLESISESPNRAAGTFAAMSEEIREQGRLLPESTQALTQVGLYRPARQHYLEWAHTTASKHASGRGPLEPTIHILALSSLSVWPVEDRKSARFFATNLTKPAGTTETRPVSDAAARVCLAATLHPDSAYRFVKWVTNQKDDTYPIYAETLARGLGDGLERSHFALAKMGAANEGHDLGRGLARMLVPADRPGLDWSGLLAGSQMVPLAALGHQSLDWLAIANLYAMGPRGQIPYVDCNQNSYIAMQDRVDVRRGISRLRELKFDAALRPVLQHGPEWARELASGSAPTI